MPSTTLSASCRSSHELVFFQTYNNPNLHHDGPIACGSPTFPTSSPYPTTADDETPRSSDGPSSVRSSSSVKSRRSRGRSRTMRQPWVVDEAEFQQLPANIQRKCFSSFERLKIAQQSSHQLAVAAADAPFLAPVPPNHLLRSQPRRPGRLRKQRTIRDDQILAHAEAKFFLSLPDKVRRLQFSPEEQQSITARLDLAQHNHAGSPSTFAATALKNQHRVPHHSHEHRRGHSIAAFPRTESYSIRTSSTISKDELSDWEVPAYTPKRPRLFELPAVLSPAPAGLNKLRRSSTIGRNMSLPRHSAIHSPRPSISHMPASPARVKRHSRSLSAGAHLRSSNDTVTNSIDSGAVHYQDPLARMKLRNYLASPQKFDEAVEFGFPSAPVSSELEHESFQPKFQRSTSANDAQQFLKDDSISFMEEVDDESFDESDADDASSVAPSSPATPTSKDGSFHRHAASSSNHSLFSPLDKLTLPSLHLTSYKPQPDAFSEMINREMTLRMTLTRPDLRAPEDVLYGWQGEAPNPVDLLALEELPVSDDVTGSHGPFSKESRNGMFRRIFGRGKSRDKKR